MIGKAVFTSLPARLGIALLLLGLLGETLLLAQTRPRLRPLRRDYFAGKFLLLPGDSRPVSLQIPRLLARVADHDLVLPPIDLLGDDQRGPDPAGLAEWLRRTDLSDLDGLILSLDLLLGPDIRGLDLLRQLRARRTGLPICGLIAEDSRHLTSALETAASGALDYLLIVSSGPLATDGGSAETRRLIDAQIAERRLTDRARVVVGRDTGAQLLVARLLLRRFGLRPKIWIGASATAQAAALAPQVSAQVAVVDGLALPGTPESTAKADLLLFVQSPETTPEGRASLTETVAQANSRGFRVAVADLSGDEASRLALTAELRRRKQFDPMLGFSAAEDPAEAVVQALAQSMARLVTIRFLRDDTERLGRAERAQIELTLVRLLQEFSYPRTVLPKLETMLRESGADPEALGPARARAEAFAREETSRLAEELFNEQYRRNAHAITLSTGQRAYYEARTYQRLQLRFAWGTAREPELRAGVYVPLVNVLYPDKPVGAQEWELLDASGLDGRLVRRFDTGNWPVYPVDAQVVQISINLNRRDVSFEGYTIRNRRRSNSTRRIEIAASNARGAFNALGRLEQLGAEGRLKKDFQLTEDAGFAQRGVIEEFSGAPWSQRNRLDMIRFLGRVRMNRYYHAPKIDPVDGERWREPYTEAELDRFKELLHAAEENFIDFVSAVRPGAQIRYSEDADFKAIVTRLDALSAIGVRYFTLAFDDAPASLKHPADEQRFKTIGVAQAQLIRRAYEHLRERMQSFELSVIPTAATAISGDGEKQREYLRELSAGIPTDVFIIWAGREVFPAGYGEAETRALAELIGRRPLIRDDFPANGGEAWRLQLGPKRGVGPKLNVEALGFLAVPMNQAYASMLPLATVADYAWNPREYDPEASHSRAFKLLYDDRSAAGVRAFAEVYAGFRPSGGPADAPAISQRLDALSEALDAIGLSRECGLLRGELAALVSGVQ